MPHRSLDVQLEGRRRVGEGMGPTKGCIVNGAVASEHRRSNSEMKNKMFGSIIEKAPPAGLEPAIFGLEVRRLVH